jgi:hypothetical protein
MQKSVVFFGLKTVIKPPDEHHPYGHGKAEPIAAIVYVAGSSSIRMSIRRSVFLSSLSLLAALLGAAFASTPARAQNAASIDLVKTRASARASLTEYERLRQLNQDGKNASDKAVEATRAASENDAALLKNAEQSQVILKNSSRLRWGPVVARWLEQGSPQLDALFAQRMFLLQVTSASSEGLIAPQQATVKYADGTRSLAHLVSVFPLLDPRLQSPSLLYIVAAHPGLIPGINLPVFLPSGSAQNGVIVPLRAVVWWQGRAWCYVEELPGKFARKAVSTSNPVTDGWFVTEGMDAKTRIVTTAAQTLLSEEFRSQIQADED